VIERLPDGTQRRHRLSTLGLDEHYRATMNRFRGKGYSARVDSRSRHENHHQEEAEMPEHNPHTDDEDEPPSTISVVTYEFATGKLHPAWHGTPPRQRYSDATLQRAKESKSQELRGRDAGERDR